MERLIRSTTEHFLGMLDDQREFFSLEDLREAGLPDFLVKRMELELMRNLQDSVTPPESDWADMSTEAVQDAWRHFLKAIQEEMRLPASYATTVLESSLADILDLMVTPRAFLPEYIFGSEKSLDADAIRERCEWIVVYTYFSRALPRFMEKKSRKTLTKEQADRIIERLDERVTAQYTSLNWAQLFDPWYALMGDKVEPGVFAEFFRDKGKPGVARLFDAESEPVHRTRLIEILSRPQFDEIDDEIDDVGEELLSTQDLKRLESEAEKEAPGDSSQAEEPAQVGSQVETGSVQQEETVENQVIKPEPKVKVSSAGKVLEDKKTNEGKNATVDKATTGDTEIPEDKATTGDKEIPEDKDTTEDKEIPEDKDTTEDTEIPEDTFKPGEEHSPQEDDDNLINRFRKTNGDDQNAPPLMSRLKKDSDEEQDIIPLYSHLNPSEDEQDEENVPIWKQFSTETEEGIPAAPQDEASDITEEEKTAGAPEKRKEELSDASEEEEEETADTMDRQTGEPPLDQADEKRDLESEIAKIRSYMKDMEEEFVDELFGGDEGSFIDTIGHISQFDSWKEAGSYISKEVFDRNMIDIYSDTAIDFTDRMQTYFLERA